MNRFCGGRWCSQMNWKRWEAGWPGLGMDSRGRI